MARCSRCSSAVTDSQRFCPNCGALISSSGIGTVAMPAPALSSTGTTDEGSLPPGTVLAQRYRISGKLGEGGMGEVYRASDLLLGQTVALKLLRPELAMRENSVDRFRNEVRMARQITHPNVCRVHDMGEADSQLFLTMEYVDGEDLASLLRRISHLAPDKAVEIARQMCAGLAAAHDKGVLHRDLKPSNVMIDGRGQVRITDFGLASAAGTVSAAETRSGTPAYMAPEQLAGREVTARSDIYALGLVLFEIFTGKRAFQAHSAAELRERQQSETPSVTSIVKDVDEAIDRVITRCLDPDPAKRPPSALSVAAALPGADPLAAALAAGETPSPELVAAAGRSEGMDPRWALAAFAVMGIGLLTHAWLAGNVTLLARVHSTIPPEALAQKARELLASFGYSDPAVSEAWGIDHNSFLVRFASRLPAARARQLVPVMRPPPVFFWYRTYPERLVPDNGDVAVNENNPPRLKPGAVGIDLDPKGRLDWLIVVPGEREEGRPPTASFDWNRLFGAAGLDISKFDTTAPIWTPSTPFDMRAAWLERAASDPVRVEGAVWRGRPVYFWSCQKSLDPISQNSAGSMNAFVAFLGALLAGAVVLAWRNRQLGRADVNGAVWTAATVGISAILARLFAYAHALDSTEYDAFMISLSVSAGTALLVAAIYLAVEPYVRRYWPDALISWVRLVSGGVSDPLVGRHILIGFAIQALCDVVALLQLLKHPFSTESRSLQWVSSTPKAIAQLLYSYGAAVEPAFYVLLATLLLFVLVRRRYLAAAIGGLVFTAILAAGAVDPVLTAAEVAVGITAVLFVLLRWGFLPVVAMFFWSNISRSLIWTLDTQAWYFGYSLLAMSVLVGLALLAFRSALAGKSIWKEPS